MIRKIAKFVLIVVFIDVIAILIVVVIGLALGLRTVQNFGMPLMGSGLLIAVVSAGSSLGGSRVKANYGRMNPELSHLDSRRKSDFPFKPVLAGAILSVIGMAIMG